MTLQDEKRRSLLSRLSRQLGYTAPALVLVASGATFQAVAGETATEPSYTNGQQAPLMLAEAHAEGDTEAEGEYEDKDKDKDKDKGEGEAEGEGEGEGDAEGEGEAEG